MVGDTWGTFHRPNPNLSTGSQDLALDRIYQGGAGQGVIGTVPVMPEGLHPASQYPATGGILVQGSSASNPGPIAGLNIGKPRYD